ncbi:MAG: chemotaxis protein CheX [candidate division Zixibacteria bacterium]|nr:chemotaxis protein CheX [candidate division Zixibacteria bacterium]
MGSFHDIIDRVTIAGATGHGICDRQSSEFLKTGDFFRIVAESTCEVITTITGAAVVLQEATTIGGDVVSSHEITARIKLSGEFSGVIGVGVDPDLARDLVARIAGGEGSSLSRKDILDGIGEIINQVSGRVRTVLSFTRHQVYIDLPLISDNGEYVKSHLCDRPNYTLIFECLNRRFSVQFCLIESN